MKNKKGFTLIELLAVIIILGILMIIAVPSVTKYISDSRKNGYVSTAKNIASGARNLVNSGSLDLNDEDTTYYIDGECIKTDTGYKSPYGEFDKAYIVVTANYNGHDYYWTSVDTTGTGVKGIINVNSLDTDNIKEGIDSGDITTDRGLDNRSKIVVVDSNCQKGNPIERTGDRIDSVTGGEYNPIKYPAGKTKATVVTGDIVTIGTQEFYVVKHSGEDLILLSHYNLNVGEYKKASAPEGIQDSEIKGGTSYVYDIPQYGKIGFSDTSYWDGKIGTDYTGDYCTSFDANQTCAYVYDSNSKLYPYVQSYKTYLEGLGATIKEARLLKLEEIIELGCDEMFCESGPAWLRETAYWLGTAGSSSAIWRARNNSSVYYTYYSDDAYHGLRPVIVI